jgi:hypothetical protein
MFWCEEVPDANGKTLEPVQRGGLWMSGCRVEASSIKLVKRSAESRLRLPGSALWSLMLQVLQQHVHILVVVDTGVAYPGLGAIELDRQLLRATRLRVHRAAQLLQLRFGIPQLTQRYGAVRGTPASLRLLLRELNP